MSLKKNRNHPDDVTAVKAKNGLSDASPPKSRLTVWGFLEGRQVYPPPADSQPRIRTLLGPQDDDDRPASPTVEGGQARPPANSADWLDSPAFQRLAHIEAPKKGQLPPELELEIIKEESYRAGINYLWHPKYRQYAQKPGNHPYDYEAFYNDPKNKKNQGL